MKKNWFLFIIFIAVVGAAVWVYRKNTKSTISSQPLTQFAIEDTASVNKIIITDLQGQHAILERQSGKGLWQLNKKYLARKDAVDLILMTINRIRVRGNVSEKGRDNVMKLLVTSGKKVEIYTGGSEPEKIYYVGNATEDHTGTFMLLEMPDIGRSEDPYVTHIEGFTGFLSTRFFTNENEWRYTGIFEYPQLEFDRVQIINHNNTNYSFEVNYKGGNDITLNSGYIASNSTFSLPIAQFDTLAIKELLLAFKKVHVESYNTQLPQNAQDSIRQITPAFTINVREKNGTEKHIDLYLKLATKPTLDDLGNAIPWDRDHFYARTMDNEFAMAQFYTFEPLVRPIEYYLKK
jgi:hypothetical protein